MMSCKFLFLNAISGFIFERFFYCNFPMQMCTSKKNVQSKKGQKPSPNGNNEEDDSNASQELNGEASS